MKQFLLLSLLPISLLGQTVVTPTASNTCVTTSTSITCFRKVGSPFPYMWGLYPPAALLTISGTNTWTGVVGGALNTACSGSPCLLLTQQYNSTAFTSGTAPSVVKVFWLYQGSESLTVGSYAGTITITPNGESPQVISVTLNVIAASGEHETNMPNPTYPVGCASSSPGNAFNDVCTLQTPYMTPPVVCSSYVDPNFGGTVKRMTIAGYATEYGANTAFSALGTYILTNAAGGWTHVIKVSDCSDVTGPMSTNIAYITMSATNDQSFYYFSGATIHLYNFVTTADVNLGSYAGAPYGFTTLYAGGTIQNSADDWVSFFDYSGGVTLICAVNLLQLKIDGAPAGGNSYCHDYSGDNGGYAGGIDWTGVSGIDSVSHKRYVWITGLPISGMYSVGTAGVLNVEMSGPTWAGFAQVNDQEPCTVASTYCMSSSGFSDHATLLMDTNGRANFVTAFADIAGNKGYASFSLLNKTSKSFRMIEEGGGMYLSQTDPGAIQPGVSDSIGGAVFGTYMAPSSILSAQITTISATNPAVVTMTNTLSGTTHVVRVDGGIGGWACANGYWTATVTGATITLTGANCVGAGSFVGQTVYIGDSQNDVQTGTNSFLGQLVVIVPGNYVKQIAMHRSVGWGSGVGYYGTTTRASMSRDGSMIAFNSNFGTIGDPSVYIAYTGLLGVGASRRNVSVGVMGGRGVR